MPLAPHLQNNVSDTDSTGWGDCVRIYELELYAYKEAAKSELLTGKAQVLGVATASAAENEGPEQAFDQDYGTKWCTMKTPSWVVFDVQDPAYADRLKVTHAGGATVPEDGALNTNDFALEVLEPREVHRWGLPGAVSGGADGRSWQMTPTGRF